MVKNIMNIIELHDFISEVAESLPEQESMQLVELRGSLEELGPKEWSHRLVLFSIDMIKKNIGDWIKLSILQGEEEQIGSVEIKPIYILLLLTLAALVMYKMFNKHMSIVWFFATIESKNKRIKS